MSEWDWLLTSHATIFQLYMWRYIDVQADWRRSLTFGRGCQRHRHFVGFFNVPVQAPTRDQPFYGYSEKPPQFSRLLRHARGYGGHILALTTGFPWGHRISTCINWKWHYLTLMKLFLNSILISSSEAPPPPPPPENFEKCTSNLTKWWILSVFWDFN